MTDYPDKPKITSGEATITYSGYVKHVTSKLDAKLAAQKHIEHVFDVEHGDIGFIDIVISEETPYIEDSLQYTGTFAFKAEFTLDEGPAAYLFEEKSVYVPDITEESDGE